jgi:uncharacterized lipoprotein YmbA
MHLERAEPSQRREVGTAHPIARRRARLAGSLALLLLAAGCMGSPPPRLYLLTSEAGGAGPAPPKRHLSIGIAPVTIRDYLDRPEIVTRATANEVTPAENARWAEPLSLNATRVIGQNLGTLLGADDVVLLPARQVSGPRYEVGVEVTRLEIDSKSTVILAAQWRISEAGTGTPLTSGHVIQSETIDGAGTDRAVAAMSRTLAAASREIAAGFEKVLAERRQAPKRPASSDHGRRKSSRPLALDSNQSAVSRLRLD